MKALIWTKHPGDILGDAIDFVTHGDAQHFGFLRADGVTVHEAYFPRVRDRLLTKAECTGLRKFSLKGNYELLGQSKNEFDDAFEAAFDANLKQGIKYDVLDLFRYLFNRPFPDGDRQTICSVYGMNCIEQVAPHLLPLVRCRFDEVSPRDHLISPMWVEEPFTYEEIGRLKA